MLRFIHFIIIAFLGLGLIQGCSSSSSGASSNNLTGTAATGAAIQGFVYVKDATGIEINVATSVDGSFSINAASMTPPFMVRVIPDGGGDTLYSFAANNTQLVNITPLSNLAMFLASSNADLDAIYTAWDGTQITVDSIVVAQAQINANLSTQLTDVGIDPTTYDFMTAVFSANGSGFDALLDSIDVVVDFSGGTFTFAVTGAPGFSFDSGIDVSAINIVSGNTSSNVSGNNGGTLAANETLATIPASIATTYNLTYYESTPGSGIVDGSVATFVVATNGTLTIGGSLVLDTPVLRNGNAHEAIWKDTTNDLEYALSSLVNGFNEINVSNNIPYTDPGFIFYGQYH